jgi:NAD(P)-dependent dehydrogenase (short-subunit alcohol dehydrogenase family)
VPEQAEHDQPEINFRGLGFTDGDVIVITGAASGIGRAAALVAGSAGLAVAAWDLDLVGAQAVAGQIADSGGRAIAVKADITDEQQVSAAWDATGALGPPAYLASNAGPTSRAQYTLVEGITAALGSMMNLTESWLSRYGAGARSAVYTASISGNLVGSGQGADWYPASKAGIVGYMRHQADKRRGKPRFNAVAPGLIATPRTEVWKDAEKAYVASVEARTPVGRRGRPEEVAHGILFLLSPAASYINGQLLVIDGGRTVAV